MQNDVEFFINDRYLILKLLKDIEKENICAISQNKLSEVTGFSKFKINAVINELIEQGYLNYLGRKRYSLTKKAYDVIGFLESKKGV